jgi:hypothetical protein
MPGAYLQTSTANPYGHRPWVTRLYTTFDDYSYLKQPQNTILRENLDMRPEIYRPPDMRGLGAVLVTGSGRVLGQTRRRTMRGLGIVPEFSTGWQRPMPPIIVRGPFVSADGTAPPMPGPAQTFVPPSPPTPIVFPNPIFCTNVLRMMPRCPPNYFPASDACGPTGFCKPAPVPAPPVMLPPTNVPPVPTPVVTGPGGTVYALPGDASSPDSPFTPPAPGELPAPGAPTTLPGGAAAAATTPAFDFRGWFNSQTWIAGVPNGIVAIVGGGGLFWLLGRKRGR